jgi:Arc/MetJ-type ribon-helix-helix transcriptional regulator
MVIGMATKKVTITLKEDQLEAIRALVAAGTASSVSGFVQHAIRVSLNDDSDLEAMLDELLDETGGPMTTEEQEWADEILGVKPQKRRSSPAA